MKNISLLLLLLFITSAATSQDLISSKIDSEFNTYQNTHNSVLGNSNASTNTYNASEGQASYMEADYTEKRWEHEISLRYRGYFVGYYNVNIIALDYSPLYSLSNVFSWGPAIGVGASFNSSGASFAMPIYASCKFKFMQGDFTPYFATSLGMIVEAGGGGSSVIGTFSPKLGVQNNRFNITAGYDMIFTNIAVSGFSISIGAII